jgi:hypothetical protein
MRLLRFYKNNYRMYCKKSLNSIILLLSKICSYLKHHYKVDFILYFTKNFYAMVKNIIPVL